jgi:hypothetical protein
MLTLTKSSQICGVSTAESSASINGRGLCKLLPYVAVFLTFARTDLVICDLILALVKQVIEPTYIWSYRSFPRSIMADVSTM